MRGWSAHHTHQAVSQTTTTATATTTTTTTTITTTTTTTTTTTSPSPPWLTLLTWEWGAHWPSMALSYESGMAQGFVVPPCGRSSQAVLVKLGQRVRSRDGGPSGCLEDWTVWRRFLRESGPRPRGLQPVQSGDAWSLYSFAGLGSVAWEYPPSFPELFEVWGRAGAAVVGVDAEVFMVHSPDKVQQRFVEQNLDTRVCWGHLRRFGGF